MRTNTRKTAQLGQLVVTAFNQAAHYSADPQTESRLATRAVMHILRQARKRDPGVRVDSGMHQIST